ncbi:MAG: RAD55 family ATPase [Acidobacteriota bacterium]
MRSSQGEGVALDFWSVIVVCELLNLYFFEGFVLTGKMSETAKGRDGLYVEQLRKISKMFRDGRIGFHGRLFKLFKSAGLDPRIGTAQLDKVLSYLLSPYSLDGLSKPGGARAERLKLPLLASSPVKFVRSSRGLYRLNLVDSVSISEYVPEGMRRESRSSAKISMCEELFDPVKVYRAYLKSSGGASSDEGASHHIQNLIRRTFGVEYDVNARVVCSAVCARVNRIFYGKGRPNTHDYQRDHPRLCELTVLIREIEDALLKVVGHSATDIPRKKALGFYYLLRFCGIFRFRYGGPVESGSDAYSFPSPVRSVRDSFVFVRSFGSIGEVGGLNYLFKGGMLPRHSTGRAVVLDGAPGVGKTVLALQKMTTIAARGGLAVYFSFEENFELIVGRLETFGLISNERYLVASLAELRREFPKLRGEDLVVAVVRLCKNRSSGRGLLLLYDDSAGDESGANYDFNQALRSIAAARDDCGYPESSVCIDSVNALNIRDGDSLRERRRIGDLIRSIESYRHFGVIISEYSERECASLPFLSDTVIRMSFGEQGKMRFLRIEKSRSQSFHNGNHPFRIIDGLGVRVYPATSAVLSSLRLRTRSTLSAKRKLAFPGFLRVDASRDIRSMPEKASILIHGKSNTKKTRIALEMALARPFVLDERLEWKLGEPPSSLFVITFKTSEKRFEQEVFSRSRRRESRFLTTELPENADSKGLNQRKVENREQVKSSSQAPSTSLMGAWDGLRYRDVRWYSPGDELTPAQVLSDVRGYLKAARNRGLPIRRVIIDELECAEVMLPRLAGQPLFWAALVQLLASEAITSFFVFGEGAEKSVVLRSLGLEVDYVLHVERDNNSFEVPLGEVPRNADRSRGFQDIDSLKDSNGNLHARLTKYPDVADDDPGLPRLNEHMISWLHHS